MLSGKQWDIKYHFLSLWYYSTWDWTLVSWTIDCSPMAQETWVHRLKKWYLMLPCLTLSIIRYGSRVKWCNPEKGVAPSPVPWYSFYRKGSVRVTLNYGRQLYFFCIEYWNLTYFVTISVWFTTARKVDKFINDFNWFLNIYFFLFGGKIFLEL